MIFSRLRCLFKNRRKVNTRRQLFKIVTRMKVRRYPVGKKDVKKMASQEGYVIGGADGNFGYSRLMEKRGAII